MEDVAERKSYLLRIYHTAIIAGLCTRKQEFADLVGVNRTTLSGAFKGDRRYLTDSLMRKIKAFALNNGLEEPKVKNTEQNTSTGSGIWLPEETRQIFENMSETIRIQAELLSRYSGSVSLENRYGPVGTPKNDRHRE